MATTRGRRRELARAKWERQHARRVQVRRRRRIVLVIVAVLAAVALAVAIGPWSPLDDDTAAAADEQADIAGRGTSDGSDDGEPAEPVTIDDLAVAGT